MNAQTFLVPVGLPKRGINATLCEVGYAKLRQYVAKLQYREAEGEVLVRRQRLHMKTDEVKRKNYVFVRYVDPATGKETRPELGRWLLDSKLPVAHKNGDPLDFRLCNLEEQLTERQILRNVHAMVKNALREVKKQKAAANRAAKKPATSDRLTPEQQLRAAFDEKFLSRMVRMAGAIIGDPLTRGTEEKPVDEKRGEEVVHQVVSESTKAIQAGRVHNVRAYVYAAVRTQARKEFSLKGYKLGHVRRPRKESKTASDHAAGLEDTEPCAEDVTFRAQIFG